MGPTVQTEPVDLPKSQRAIFEVGTRTAESVTVLARFKLSMALTFDSTSASYAPDPGTVAIIRDQSRTAALLCDGAGSWGAGVEAAAWSLMYLQRRWAGPHLPEPSALLEDIASLKSVIPKEFPKSEFSCNFDLVLLYCSASAVRYFSSGLFSIVLFDGRLVHSLFQPNTLGAELIKQGAMTEDEASRFHCVGMGPWIMDEALDPKMSGEVVLARGSYLVVLHHSLAERLDYAILQHALSSTKPAAALTEALRADVSVVTLAG
jgi:hypothetical protein